MQEQANFQIISLGLCVMSINSIDTVSFHKPFCCVNKKILGETNWRAFLRKLQVKVKILEVLSS